MSKADLREMVLPTSVRAAVLQLFAALDVAETRQALNMAAQRTQGFVFGLETAAAFKPDVIEMLYIGFEIMTNTQLAKIQQVYYGEADGP